MKVKKKYTRMGKPKPSTPKSWRGRVARRRAHVKLIRRKERPGARRRREDLRAEKRARRRRPHMMVTRLIAEQAAHDYHLRRRHAASLNRDAKGRFLPNTAPPRAGAG